MADDHIFTTQDAADYLGAHIETIRRLARKGEIPAFKVGKDWRFSENAIRQWADGQQQGNQLQPTVLAVDDNTAITNLMRRTLSPLGCRVRTAETGRQGLDIISAQQVDLVLLDLFMPEMNGAEFIAHLKQQHIEIPVIIVTGHPDSDLIEQAMQHGPFMLLKKPVVKASLLSAVKMTLNAALQNGPSGGAPPA